MERVLAFTLLMAVATGLVFGLLPALQVRGLRLHDTLKDANRGSSVGRGHAWMRNALVVAEIALACVLLVGAGLLIRSFMRVLDVDLGFQPESAAAMRVDPNSSYKTQEQKNAYFTEVLRRVNEVRGIDGAGCRTRFRWDTTEAGALRRKARNTSRTNIRRDFRGSSAKGIFTRWEFR